MSHSPATSWQDEIKQSCRDLTAGEVLIGEQGEVPPIVVSDPILTPSNEVKHLENPSVPDAEIRLATYGTLAPGKPNHHHLSDLKGTWIDGVVRGHLKESGWGAAMGYPGLIIDASGPALALQVFESHDLPLHWPRIDAFEGEGYRRVPIPVETAAGTVMASIYALAVGQNTSTE